MREVFLVLAMVGSLGVFGCGGADNPVQPQEQPPIEVKVPDELLVQFPDSMTVGNVVQVEVVGAHDVTIHVPYLSTWRSRPGFFYFTLSGSIENNGDKNVVVEEILWEIRGKSVPIQATRLPKVVPPGYTLPFYVITGDISETMRYESYTFRVEVR